MKKILVVMMALLFLSPFVFGQAQNNIEKCGVPRIHEVMIAKDPSWAQKFADQRASLQATANYYLQYKAQQDARGERITSVSAIPVIFHYVIDSAQFNNLGGTAGIIQRINSQIAVLNADYNKENADSTAIPASWKSLYSSVGVHFGLAGKDPGGACTPGFEVKIISGSGLSDAGFSNQDYAFPEAKTAGTGLPAWDVTKYYNVWCVNFTGAAANLLGLTVSLSEVPGFYPADQEGVCILYNVVGSTGPSGVAPPGTGSWYNPYNLGRTLTHETGHLLEIWHPWGDDGGQCPTWSSSSTVGGVTCLAGVGADDGLSDTPPESNCVYGNPTYTISGGTFNDCCMMHGTVNTQPNGIACLSFLDYTDDDAMHMFTTQQAAAMAAMVLVPPTGGIGATGAGAIGENYTLTQNPGLLIGCSSTGVEPSPIERNSSLSVYPNPTTGEVNITINSAAEILNQIVIVNLLGQEVTTMNGQPGRDYYTLNLSGNSKGIYFIKCNFESGTVTRKILLQ